MKERFVIDSTEIGQKSDKEFVDLLVSTLERVWVESVEENSDSTTEMVDVEDNIEKLKDEIEMRFTTASEATLIDNVMAWFQNKKGKMVRRKIGAGTHIKITSGSGFGLDGIKIKPGWRRTQ